MKLPELTITQAAEKLQKREISSLELTKAVLAQIKEKDKNIHAFLTLTEDLALAQAKAADKERAAGKNLHILAGIPMAVKDNILLKGIKCTAASKILENYIAPYEAAVIKKLKEKGAVIVGKTNLDEFAMGASTENSAFGVTKNPHDPERVPGGSSGGSAAAVASHQCIWALGSDTGGSIRQPASFCGVVGLKPTYGRVSRWGLIAMAHSLDQIGPITKTVEDARIVLEAIEGKDELDSTSIRVNPKSPACHRYAQALAGRQAPNPKQAPSTKSQTKNLRIGVPKECFIEGLDKEVEATIKSALKELEKIGCKIEQVSLPNLEYALPCYYIIVFAEVSANLARYDGIKYGRSAIDNENIAVGDLLDIYLETRGAYLGKEVKRRIMLGTYTLSAGYYEAYYLKAQKVRSLIKKDFNRVFSRVDAIIMPTSPTPAFKIGERIEDPVKMYLADIYTVPVNLAGLPGISVPGFVESDKLPVGLQIIGRPFEDELILEIARAYENTIL